MKWLKIFVFILFAVNIAVIVYGQQYFESRPPAAFPLKDKPGSVVEAVYHR